MNFLFENQGTNTYLVYTVQPDDNVDTLSLGMLTNNKIPGLATTLFTQMDTTRYIRFNVSAKITVKQFFSGPVNKKRLIGVFSGIVDAMLSAEEYMIDENSILLNLDYIFADVSTCETVLICLPVTQENKTNGELGAFFKNIMFETQFDQTENCDHVAKIINYLNSTPVFSLADFKSLLDEIKSNSIAISQNIRPVQPSVVQSSTPIKMATPTPPPAPIQTNQFSRPPVTQTPPPPRYNPPAPIQTNQFTSPQVVQTPPAPQFNPPVPVTANAIQPQMSTQSQSAMSEKKISMFGLLMHYNKDNAELYKSQKKAKKMAGGGSVQPQIQQNTSFAIPGQSVPAPSASNVTRIQPQPKAPAMSQPKQQAQVPARPVAPQAQPQYIYQPQSVPQGQPMNFGETTVLSGKVSGETTVLGATSVDIQVKPHLIRAKNNEKIIIDKPVFRIGKEKSYVDYFIGDNSTISRSHANIITREGEYYIVDTNSTNHTYLNGVMLQSNGEAKLSHGNKIRLANEDFDFLLY